MTAGLVRWLKRAGILAVVVVVTLFVGRIVETQRGPPLRVWHTYVPEELSVDEMERTDWAGYVKAEAALFDRLGAELKRGLEDEDRIPGNRYFDGSPIYPPRFQQDWNRSYVLEPDGPPLGAVVFLHGLTDSPYSLRHIARLYRAAGWVSVAPRCRRTAPCRRRCPRCSGRSGTRRPGSPCGRPGGGPDPRPRCTSWGSRTVERSR